MLPKLVRDKIPKCIVADGKIPVCEFVDDTNVQPYIFNKIREEVAELHYECTTIDLDKDKIIDEFADVLTVLEKLARTYNITEHELAAAIIAKKETHGGYDDNIILMDIKY